MSDKPEPSDSKLYEKVKKEVYKQHPKHSAYRSGIVVKTYKERYAKKNGNRKQPYKGKKRKKKALVDGSEKNGLIREEKLDINIRMMCIVLQRR